MLEMLFSSFFIALIKKWCLVVNFMPLMLIYLFLKITDSGEMIKLILTLLSIWLMMMMILTVSDKEQNIVLLILMGFLMWSLQVSFYSDSLLTFYLGFEMSVLPVLFIILGWGYQPDRLEAGFYMILYTVFFSLPLLMMIMSKFYLKLFINDLVLWMFMLAFFVKLPMFGVHLWLPRAHVEAPVYGSMILAGIMLKLGGYGMIQVIYKFNDKFIFNCNILIVYSLLGGIFLSLICFMQSDMKMLIAYSSVVHMSLVLSGILTLRETGLLGSLCVMVGHGFCSSGLFYLLGIYYSRVHSRSFYINQGLLSSMSISFLWWFLFCSANLSFPPSLSLVGEILLMVSIITWLKKSFFILCFLNFFSSMYSIYLYAFCCHGQQGLIFSLKSVKLKELMISFFHWVPLNILILDLSLFQ
uniref:NADH-ubiquinone oxidoreductase chain 4 n=1 Tax=Agonoscena pistaciae TaxID=1635299 RepID=A0A8F2TDZ3_9HEMI|nr:NADH dehydrogenase subunit 4 [Agonoscena pistaciae]